MIRLFFLKNQALAPADKRGDNKGMSNNSNAIAIIGAGPVGLFAVFECGQLGMSCHLIDALDETGGQCSALYPEKPIYDIPAYPQISGGELIAQLEMQIAPYKPQKTLGARVMTIDGTQQQGFTLTMADGTTLKSPAVIIAAGGGAFGPNKPPLEGLEQFENKSIFYHVAKKDAFKGKRVLIAGGGDSALDWALALHSVAARIILIHRRARFRAAPDTVAQIHALAEQNKLDLITPYLLEGLEGTKNGQLQKVRVKTLQGERKDIECDAMLAFFGLRSEPGPIKDWNLAMRDGLIEVAPHSCETSREGIFAIGDIAHYHNKLKLILTGFAEAATASRAIYPLLFEGKNPRFVYSTTLGDPAQRQA